MILQSADIVKRFGGLVAVDTVSLGVEEGEILGLIGPNGAGKTTLLNVISGVYRPNAGTVRFKGEDITGLTPERICGKGIARTFQKSRPFPEMSALENVRVAAVFGNRQSLRDPRAYAEEMLDAVGFPLSKETPAKDLNTVRLRQLDLARALASSPELLLLDEVAAGLTPTELTEMITLILRIRDQGVTIVVIEHVMRAIMQMCDRITVLHYGKKIAEGTPQQIVEDEKVADAYLGDEYLLG